MPHHEESLGDLSVIPRQAESPSFEGLEMTPEDWFILSRVDGNASFRDVIGMSPVGRDATAAMLLRLLEAGLITVPTSASAAPEAVQARGELPLPPPPTGWPTRYDDFESSASDMGLELPVPPELRKLADFYHAHLSAVTFYQLLDLDQDAPDGEIRRRYFTLSKLFHPDRFFRQDLGPYGERFNAIFRALNEAHRVLGNRARRRQYDERLAAHQAPAAPAQAAPVERPRSVPLPTLLGEAKRAEREGNFRQAFELYEKALRARSSAELMNRSAECLIRLGEHLDTAEERARGAVDAAPDRARYWVALAYVLELRGKTDEAIKDYQHALQLDPAHEGAKVRLARLVAR